MKSCPSYSSHSSLSMLRICQADQVPLSESRSRLLSLSALAAVCSRSGLAWPVAAFIELLLLLVLLVRPHLQWLTGSGMCKGFLEGCSPAAARAGVPAFCLQYSQVGCVASAASRPVAFCKRREHGMDGRPSIAHARTSIGCCGRTRHKPHVSCAPALTAQSRATGGPPP